MTNLASIFIETRLLFHRLSAVADALHRADRVTASMRGVLESLAAGEPQTVPQMARARPVSRQHIQAIVNMLLERGLVELVDNLAHKKSPLVRLTAAGAQTIATIQAREASLLSQLSIGLTESDLATTRKTLQAIRRYFESTEWRKIAQSQTLPTREAENEHQADGDGPV